MKLFATDRAIPIGEVGFQDKDPGGVPYDFLGRAQIGGRLSDLVERIDQPLVIACDGAWGSGKSHFLKLWTGEHRKKTGGKATVIYFDAFEHDYLDDPLISLVAAVQAQMPKTTGVKKAVEGIRNAAAKLAKPVMRVGLAAATSGASELAAAATGPLIEATGKEATRAVDEFWKRENGRRAAMAEFRKGLVALTKAEDETPQKIVFVVDELDRCRPDFALMLLEIMKHFFAVPNVHFVLGVNLAAFECSVRARYGEGIDARKYLQKFIHLTVAVPKKLDRFGSEAWDVYFERIVENMELPEDRAESVKQKLTLYARKHPISLRDVERIASRIALMPEEVGNYHWGFRAILSSSIVMDVMCPELLFSLRTGKSGIAEVENVFSIESAVSEGDHSAPALNHAWRRVMLDDPGPDTMDFTKQAFGHTPANHRVSLERLLTEDLDMFHLPGTV